MTLLILSFITLYPLVVRTVLMLPTRDLEKAQYSSFVQSIVGLRSMGTGTIVRQFQKLGYR
jgi:hypothetical protein